jgi:hypothetical protein
MHAKATLVIIIIVAALGLTITASAKQVFAGDTGGIKGQKALGLIAKLKAHASSSLSSTEQGAFGRNLNIFYHTEGLPFTTAGLSGTSLPPVDTPEHNREIVKGINPGILDFLRNSSS